MVSCKADESAAEREATLETTEGREAEEAVEEEGR